MDLTASIKLLQDERKLMINAVKDLTVDQYLKIPEGSANNILWNLGHILATQQILHYMLSRVEMRIEKEIVSMFRTGTSPAYWKSTPDVNKIKELMIEIPELFLEDYRNGIFIEFRPYKTSTGFELTSLEDALSFNHFHEGTHLGIILGLIKKI